MRPEDFSAQAPGQVVRAEWEGKAYWAFAPAPLPPTIGVDWELASLVSEATGAIGALAGEGRRMRNPDLLVYPFLLREAVLSSRIEGTQAELTDLYAFEARRAALPGTPPAEGDEDVGEVANYVVALQEGIRLLGELPVSLRLIRRLHEILMTDVRGEHRHPGHFREVQNYIAPSHSDPLTAATYVPPPPAELPAALDPLERYLHAEDAYPPLVRLALVHYQFEAIHPFEDGNGRLGRLLISLLLVDWDLLPLPLLYLSAYLESRRDEYYRRLRAVSTHGDWRGWLVFFLRGVVGQARSATRLAVRLSLLEDDWRGRLAAANATARCQRLAESLFRNPIVTVADAARILKVGYHTARNNVLKLVEVGILQPAAGEHYRQHYASHELFRAVSDQEPDAATGKDVE